MDLLGPLPTEMAQQVLDFLPARDLGACCRVSRRWRELVDCHVLWKKQCRRLGWNDKDFIDQERTHRPRTKAQDEESPLWTLNDWALNYRVHFKLPVSWERKDSMSYLLEPHPSPVTIFSCDEHLLAIGYADGTVSILDVWRVPRLQETFCCTLPDFAILGIIVSGRSLVVLQSMLIQIYFQQGDRYNLIDAKSFEMGYSMIEVLQKYEEECDFGTWYTKHVGSARHTKESIASVINFQIFSGVLYVSVRDYQMIYGWSLQNGTRVRTIHIPSRTCKLRDMVIHDGYIYLIYASRSVRHITSFCIEKESFIFEITTPECKTQKLIAGHYLIGVTISGPGMLTPGVIKVWDKTNGKNIASRQTGFLSFKTVVELYDLIVYGEGRTLYLWDPKNNALLKSFSFGEVISYVMSCPFRFLLAIGSETSWVWDWVMGSKLYRVHPQTVKNGDYRGLVYADPTMLVLKIDAFVIEMITFC